MSALPRSYLSEGPLQRSRSIAGASFLYSDAPRPERCGVHTHEKVLLSFLLRGSIIEVDERAKKAECEPVTLHSSPPGMRHAHLIQSPRVTTLCFALEREMLAELGGGANVFDQPITTRGPAIALAPKFQREMSATDSASDLVLRGLIFELVGELSRRGTRRLPAEAPEWLRRAKEMINDTWNQSTSMEEIATAVGVHPSHLNRVFRAYMNQTPGEYLRHIRMTRATRDVLSGDLPFKVIAARAGFADQAHFTREFRRRHGMSPLEMRRAIRG
ncbi:MAG TPA: AraC family transcriptional regulator [Fimbriimonadaceae bacterium]|nr:AraC family transcriptional regulator [Fimbriimonadaceae bacterium]